jgi:hypothetical protein
MKGDVMYQFIYTEDSKDTFGDLSPEPAIVFTITDQITANDLYAVFIRFLLAAGFDPDSIIDLHNAE